MVTALETVVLLRRTMGLNAAPPLSTLVETLRMSESHSVSCNGIALHSGLCSRNRPNIKGVSLVDAVYKKSMSRVVRLVEEMYNLTVGTSWEYKV